MDWLIYSGIMFVFSISYYLILRSLQRQGMPSAVNMLMMFLPAVPLYIIIILAEKINLVLSLWHLSIIFIATYLFSYLGNIYSLKGIKEAPNSGYSLIIQKSYAVYTTFAAALLFGSVINAKTVIAILVIIIFSGFILIEKQAPKGSLGKAVSRSWILPTFMAFFLFGNLTLVSKWLLEQGITPIVRGFYLNIFVTGMYAINLFSEIKYKGLVVPKINGKQYVQLILLGISCGAFNLAMQYAFNVTPNIGIVSIINTASITPITVFSAILFKESLNLQKIVGIIGVSVGLAILVI